MSEEKWTITQLVSYIKSRLSNDFVLRNVHVNGEIGNFTNHYSGHWYFTLKDSQSLINCCMFKNTNYKVDFIPKNGDNVDVCGSINVFEKSGQLQLICSTMAQAGNGDFYARFEKTKNRLEPLGYFDESRKRVIPPYSEHIAVITGANTAALKDIRITVAKRWPMAQLHEVYALVQGSEAIPSIISAIQQADRSGCDVMILARGGGSVDDLWCFNDEGIAKAIYQCKTPIVTGIGHEIDTTIADLVADKRCATPTAAAEAVTADYRDVLNLIDKNTALIKTAMQKRINNASQWLDYQDVRLKQYGLKMDGLKQRIETCRLLNQKSINALMQTKYREIEANAQALRFYGKHQGEKTAETIHQKIDRMNELLLLKIQMQKKVLQQQHKALVNNADSNYRQLHQQFTHKIELLDGYSPLKTLARGYSIATKSKQVIKSAAQVELNDEINIRLSDGNLKALVKGKE